MSKGYPKIVVIGGVACGPKAAARARRFNPDAEITLIEQGSWLSYAGCGLPYYVGGSIPEIDGLRTTQYGAVRDEKFFADVKGVDTRTGAVAESIDRENKTLAVRNIGTGETYIMDYDKLVIATGASPIRPPIDGLDHERVFFMHAPADADRLRSLIESGKIDKAVFVGGGRIALELTEAFFAQAVDSVIIEREESLLPTVLDPEMAASVAYALRKQGVEILTSESVLRIERSEEGPACRVITETLEIAADAVIVATGVRPNTELALDAGLDIGKTGAIAVNAHLQTSDPDIYAGGDCAECTNLVSGEKTYAPLGSTANRHGRVIGDNVAGGDSTFPGVVGTAFMRTMGLNIAMTGITERQATALGYDTLSSIAPWMDRAHFYPGGKPIMIKMVADVADGRLLGAQAIGAGDVMKRIDALAAALVSGATIDDIANLDIGYAPPYSTALDNIAHAANILRNKRDGLVESITPMEFRNRPKSAKDYILLDVREQGEVEKDGFEADHVRAIPLSRLSDAVDDLPKDKELICVCKVGMRGYEAYRMLKGLGLSDVKFLEGGIRLWTETAPSIT